ncbi:MAG: VOC family protein [Gammaproteobacteria bacterium]
MSAAYPGPTVIPCLRYRDAHAAIAWLDKAFGFTPLLVVPGPENTVVHAELSNGNGIIMLGSASRTDNAYGQLMKLPGEIGGFQTQTIYLIVPDADVVYRAAVDGGAAIVIDLKDEEHGGRGFTCRDLEGHVWSIGTYAPGLG